MVSWLDWLMLGAPVALWLWRIAAKSRHSAQARKLQTMQAHSVEIETQDNGGYNLVSEPEQAAEVDANPQALTQRQSPPGITYICQLTHAYGIEEETRLLPDGTFLQIITERSGVAYRNTGSWSKQWPEPVWDATLGHEILLKNYADPLEVVLKASTVEIERRETLVPAHAFQPQLI